MFGKRIGKIQEREVEGLSEGNCIINLWLPKKGIFGMPTYCFYQRLHDQ